MRVTGVTGELKSQQRDIVLGRGRRQENLDPLLGLGRQKHLDPFLY